MGISAGREPFAAGMKRRSWPYRLFGSVRCVTGGSRRENAMRSLRAVLVPAVVAAVALFAGPAPRAQVGIGVTVGVAPPPLPVYAQPPLPGPGYMWTPGYWAYGAAGYYWVPGTWVQPPAVGLLWTPGYWGWGGSAFAFHAGFWGPTVGFYGGINYGFGYGGVGFSGGYWNNGQFAYNRAVTNVSNTRVTNVYNRNVTVNNTRTAYNGGAGGTMARPTPAQEALARQGRPATAEQVRQRTEAANNPALRYSENHGSPSIAATRRPGDFTGRNVEAARGAERQPTAAERRPAAAEHRPSAAQERAARTPAQERRAVPQERRNAATQERRAVPQERRNAATQERRAARPQEQQRAVQQRAAQQRGAAEHRDRPDQR
jgi:hypothetical protein